MQSASQPISRDLAVRQGLAVRDDIVLRAEHRQEPVAGVVGPPVHGDGPLQHGADAQPDGAGDLRHRVPDRGQRLQHVAAGDLRDRQVAEAREGVHLQRASPQPRGLRAAPPGALLLDDAPGGLGEGRNAEGPALLGQRVSARAGQLPVRQRLLAGLGQRDEDDAAETDLPLAAPDDEPLDPAAGSGLLDVEVEPVSVAVSSGRSGAHEGGGQPVVGMPAPGLASAALAGIGDIIHSLIVIGMAVDRKGRSRWKEVREYGRNLLIYRLLWNSTDAYGR